MKWICALIAASIVAVVFLPVTVKPATASRVNYGFRQTKAIETLVKVQEDMVRLQERQTRALEAIAKEQRAQTRALEVISRSIR